ncbi:MAG TPA: hypothetical protein VGD74_01175 [Vulgatibacter sp.]
MFRPSVLGFAACFALHACSPPEREGLPPDDRRIEIGDPGIERSGCPAGNDGPAFRRIAKEVERRDVRVGNCGEVAWRDRTGSLHFASTDAEPREIAAQGWHFWLDRDRLLYSSERGITLEAAGVEVATWQVHDTWYAGVLPGGESFWACSDTGIERLDPGNVVGLTPDFLQAEYTYGCMSIDVSRSGAIAYPTGDHRIGFVDVTTGVRRTLEHGFFPYGTVDDEGLDRLDAIRLSPDGAIVLHEKRWRHLQYAEMGEGEVTVLEGDSTTPVRLPGLLGDRWGLEGVQEWWGGAPLKGTAPGVFLPGLQGKDSHLLGLGTPIPMRVAPLSIRGNQLFVATSVVAALLELGSGVLHPLLGAPAIEAVVPFRWGGPVAISHFTEDCIRWPNRPESCHTRIWALAIWDAERRARHVAFGSEPIRVHAIAPDGRMIVAGRILDEPPPAIAKPKEIPWRTLLVDSDGKALREFDPDAWIRSGIGGEHFAVVERARRTEQVPTEELVAIDWETGGETVLVTARSVDSWALDQADRRVTAIVTPDNDGVSRELWTGVVGR